MLYKKNTEKALSGDLFTNPTAEYRGTPFWAWNNLLTKEELCRQIDVFREMGLGGFHMHVRTGLVNEYLSDEYMQLIRDCINHAKENEMLAWLYDEDRWPSGAAGGIVTKEHKYRARNLLFTNTLDGKTEVIDDASSRAGRSANTSYIAAYDVQLDENGWLVGYKKIEKDAEAAGQKWYALLDVAQDQSWYNGQAYVDTLNKEAIEKFVQVTHERYLETVGDEFDKTVPAIFTDEPQFIRKDRLWNSICNEETNIKFPWTDRVPELYKEVYGEDILDTLPELFWDLPDSAPSVHRYRYHDFIAELFASAFADTVGDWCSAHNIALTGHMMEEPTLESQCHSLGEAMRSYRSFAIPGTDNLCDSREFTTAKQAQSACHQYGREGVLSELYGVTGWDADFRLYKLCGDWQAALGITVRVPHLSWYAMAGEAKRDYPASISYQSAWYKKYHLVEDHFSRLNTALTRGKPDVRIGVIHPIESFWLHWGPNDKSALYRQNLDRRFDAITHWLLEGCIDFDFIAESLLPSQCEKGSAPLKVGVMAYDTIIVPACETLRATTLERLKAFSAAGGRLIFLGEAPTLIDALPSDEGKALYEASEKVDFSRGALLTALEPDRSILVRSRKGHLCEHMLHQLRTDGDNKWLFLCQSGTPYNKNLADGQDDILTITVKGEYTVNLYDTFTGGISPVEVKYLNGNTVIRQQAYGYDSFLFRLTPGNTPVSVPAPVKPALPDKIVYGKVPFSLSEDNVLLLDIAEYKLDDEAEFSPAEEILRLDNICRSRLGMRNRNGGIIQPWVTGKIPNEHKLTLKYTFESEIDYEGASIALENADEAVITFNGEAVSEENLGNYVDITISKRPLPPIKKGTNTLLVTLPFGKTSNAENIFILGRFGVRVEGYEATVTALPEKIAFGDITRLGMPFYGANITYKMKAAAKDGRITVQVSDYAGACVSVAVDGVEAGDIIYQPYILTVDNIAEGEHEVEITLYGNRYNSFGPIHLVDDKESWHGPGAWRSVTDKWTYEYNLRKVGILKQPVFEA